MKHKKIAVLAMSALLLFTASASAATYDVEDSKVHDQLKHMNDQIKTIQEYLEIIKDKELSQDTLDKVAVERKNESMAKLSGNVSSLVSTQDGSFDWESLKNPHDFLGDFTKEISRSLGVTIKGTIDSDIIKITASDIDNMFKDIGLGKISSTEFGTIDDIIMNNRIEIGKQWKAFTDEDEKQDAIELAELTKIDKQIAEINNAKPERQDGAALMNKLGGYSSLLNGTTTQTGAILGEDSKTIFKTEGTESPTAAQERATALITLQTKRDAILSVRAIRKNALAVQLGRLQILLDLNDLENSRAKGAAEKAAIERQASTIKRNGERPRRMFEDRYPGWISKDTESSSSNSGIGGSVSGSGGETGGINLDDFIVH